MQESKHYLAKSGRASLKQFPRRSTYISMATCLHNKLKVSGKYFLPPNQGFIVNEKINW